MHTLLVLHLLCMLCTALALHTLYSTCSAYFVLHLLYIICLHCTCSTDATGPRTTDLQLVLHETGCFGSQTDVAGSGVCCCDLELLNENALYHQLVHQPFRIATTVGRPSTMQRQTVVTCIHDAGVLGPCKTTIGTAMMQEFWDHAK